MAKNNSALMLLALVAGTLSTCGLGIGTVGFVVYRSLELGFESAELETREQQGRQILAHPSLGYSLQHPGPSYARAPEVENQMDDMIPIPVEVFVYRSDEEENDLQMILQRLPELDESSARSTLEAFQREVGDVHHHEFAERGPKRWEGKSWVVFEDGPPLTVRMHAFESAGRGYLILLTASGHAPEELEGVLGSFTPPGGEASGPYTPEQARESFTSELWRPALRWLHGGFGGIGPFCWEGYARSRCSWPSRPTVFAAPSPSAATPTSTWSSPTASATRTPLSTTGTAGSPMSALPSRSSRACAPRPISSRASTAPPPPRSRRRWSAARRAAAATSAASCSRGTTTGRRRRPSAS